MSAFCGDPICAARVQMWLAVPESEPLRPCPACVAALAECQRDGTDVAEDWVREWRAEMTRPPRSP